MGAAALSAASMARAAGANEKVVVGLVGHGNQGGQHLKILETWDDVEVAYVCDPDAARLENARKESSSAKLVSDLRRILDDPSVDAVVIAAPDHWHAPAALLALDAGKHVYVEKPCAHNLREARLLRDAARRHQDKLKVQHGTQTRSSQAFMQVMQMLREGVIGEVKAAKAWNIQKRKDIGHGTPSEPPAGFDYDLWVGPAEMMPFQSNRYHYTWHWWYNFGCGGIGNDGIHHLDYARWGLGVDSPPRRVSALGGKFFFDDDQQFPDTQQVAFEFSDGDNQRLLVYEQRLWSVTYPFNVDAGAEFYGTKGEMFLSSRGKIRILGPRNTRIDWQPKGALKCRVEDNQRNWLDCIRHGGTPHANMEIAYNTVSLVHLGNIATRVGRTLQFDPTSHQIVGDDQASALLARRYRQAGHWAIPANV